MNSCSSSVIKFSLKRLSSDHTQTQNDRVPWAGRDPQGSLNPSSWMGTCTGTPHKSHRVPESPNQQEISDITKLESNWSICKPSKATFYYRTVIVAHFLQSLIHWVYNSHLIHRVLKLPCCGHQVRTFLFARGQLPLTSTLNKAWPENLNFKVVNAF